MKNIPMILTLMSFFRCTKKSNKQENFTENKPLKSRSTIFPLQIC